MSINNSNEATEMSSERNDIPKAAPRAPTLRRRSSMSCGMGKNSMSMILAVFVGVAIGALVFGGGGSIASATQVGSWTFVLFLLPCFLMLGAMMVMGTRSGSDEKL